MKLGEWMTINEGINSKTIPQILQHHAAATEYASKSYKVTIVLCIFSTIETWNWVLFNKYHLP